MAHFAELDGSNIVFRVCVVDNTNVPSDKHIDGETWCTNFWGGAWKQTSYNNSFRKSYAAVGDTYDAAKDKFIKETPFPSWVLNGEDDWVAPVTKPSELQADGYDMEWIESDTRFEGTKKSDDSKHRWDPSDSAWIAL